MKIQELARAYDANVLKQIARDLKIETKNLNKDQVADALAKHFAQRANVERSLAQLNPVEREILQAIQRADGQVFASALKRVLLQAKIIAPTPEKNLNYGYSFEPYTGNPGYSGTPALEDATARLLTLGLVFGHEVASGNRQVIGFEGGKYLVIPQEILTQLPPAPVVQETAPTPAHIVAGSARTLQRELSRYWSFVKRSGALELMSQGWLYKKTVIEIAALLGWQADKKRDEKTDLHFFFLRRLLMDLDLLRAESTAWDAYQSAKWVPDDEAFWSRSPQERTRAAFEAWRDGDAWNELRIPKMTYGSDHRKPAPKELQAARKILLDQIKMHGAHTWVTLETLHNEMRLTHYEFLFPRFGRQQYYNPYRANESTPYYQTNNTYSITYKDIKDEASGWEMVEAAILTHMVSGPLFWLGLVDLGSDKKDAPATMFRLNETGAWLLDLQSAVTFSHEGGRVVVQPNFQIVAMEPIADNVLMTLDAFAQFEGGDNALTYRLARESVYRGQRNGWDAARIITFLEEMAQMPLPQNVRRSLEEWQTQHERITIRRNVPLLQADAPATLDGLFAHETAQWGQRAAPHIALPRGNAQEIANALRDAGLFPLFTRAGQTDAPASVITNAEGALEFFGRAPSIYAYGAVEAFTEHADAHHAHITPASVRAAVHAKIGVPEILNRLQHVHRGPLPPKLVQRIKAWGKFYGDAKMGHLILVEFRNDAARQELLADPELMPYLESFDAGKRPLALVHPDATERVRELLAERGIDLSPLGRVRDGLE